MAATQDLDDERVVDVAHYLRVLRDHALVLVAGLLVGLLLGLVAAQLQGPSYTATAEVVVQPVGGGGAVSLDSDSGVNIDTQQQIASSTAVAQRAAADLGGAVAPDALLADLTVSVPDRSSVLSFSYTADDPREAQERAQAFADAYLSQRQDRGVERIAGLVATAEQDLAEVQGDLLETREQLLPDAGSPGQRDTEIRQNLLLAQASSLQGQLTQLNSIVVDAGEVIQEAGTATSGNGLTRAAVVAALTFFGLLVGVVLAFVVERTNQPVRRATDVERTTRLPVLASLGEAGSRRRRGTPAMDPTDALAVRLVLLSRASRHRVVVLTSAGGQVATRALAADLADAVRRTGTRVAVVDAPPGPGRWVTTTDDLGHDLVLVPAGPVRGSAEGLLAADDADAVVLLVGRGSTLRDELVEAAAALDGLSTDVLGAVVTTSSPESGADVRRRDPGDVDRRPDQAATTEQVRRG